MAALEGLTRISTEDLERLLRLVHRGELSSPIRRSELLTLGLNHVADRAEILLGLDRAGARALLVGVIAERKRRTPPTSSTA